MENRADWVAPNPEPSLSSVAVSECSRSLRPSQCSSQPAGHLQPRHFWQGVAVDSPVKGLVLSP